ncbi:glycosyltransferase family 1 protein [Paenibacillus psychroresistens]|uniref:Glycosyltransferase family 1 protein n=1 Tax=Paenibacillus psychroresistens TaxID=1778678 RepID=A0A6B8RNU8_9BACL|nr:glycosyltransferase [Paenibacillus psychroresistens]QGQ97699.1 glycosyltransferase family 1 protein [Paenibacillus psychroresistens]
MKIALAHFRVGQTDGVSLEMEKWKDVLERMGHEVLLLAGSEGQTQAYVIPELHYKHPMNEKFVYNAYEKRSDYDSENEFVNDVMAFSKTMERKLVDFIKSEEIDLFIPHNLFSLGWSLPAGIALTNALKTTGISCIALHHNFYWQRERYSKPTCPIVKEWLGCFFPPDLPNLTHVVSNRLHQDELMQRRQLNSVIIPNMFDFNGGAWSRDDYNESMRRDIRADEDAIIILQATRVTERKTIEIGIDTVAQLQSKLESLKCRNAVLYNGKPLSDRSRLIYVLAGMPESNYEYTEKLRIKAERLGVDLRFINSLINRSRTYSNGQKIYSLWDAYIIADFVTFPSVIEGWGNQLLETVFAQKPLLIYEYPVYEMDIRDYGFDFVSLGNTHHIDADGLASVDIQNVEEAAARMAELLTDTDAYNRVVQHNFQIGRSNFSLESLQQLLEPLIEEVNK